MALLIEKTVTYMGHSIVFKEAYARISEMTIRKPYEPIEGNPETRPASVVTVMTYSDSTCTKQLDVYHYEVDFDPNLSTSNNWSQAYSFLKTTTDFIDAKDV
jgi:hypothetical protein